LDEFAPEETDFEATGLADRSTCAFLPRAFLVGELDFTAFLAARFAGFTATRLTDFFLPMPSLSQQIIDIQPSRLT
jgi:hypothetical protein